MFLPHAKPNISVNPMWVPVNVEHPTTRALGVPDSAARTLASGLARRHPLNSLGRGWGGIAMMLMLDSEYSDNM